MADLSVQVTLGYGRSLIMPPGPTLARLVPEITLHITDSLSAFVPTAISLAWDAVSGADAYWLAMGTEFGASDIFNANLNSTSLGYSPALGSGSYYWRVYAVVAGVLGDPSDEGFFLVP